MMQIEPLFCPCCTPVILYSLVQSSSIVLPRQLMWLGTGALTAVITQKEDKQTSKEIGVQEACQ
jgi:hypothetical protein